MKMNLTIKEEKPEPAVEISLRKDGKTVAILANGVILMWIQDDGDMPGAYVLPNCTETKKLKEMGFSTYRSHIATYGDPV